ncbi:phage terminase large subunit [Sulfitobacter mediterraneus]|jgi:predicted phage terminase large subunit-like protein|nr:phage terminase large subunit [Sulfitobacter mediterraneus]KIN79157.1 putative phage protein large terminase [Sulfitobacter mediterraneus KCTC 32188]
MMKMTKLSPEDLANYAQAARRTNLHVFLSDAFGVLFPDEELSGDWYIEALCYALQTAAQQDGGRLMVTMPPRYLKSVAASVVLPAWILGKEPATKVIVASYAEALAKEQSRLFRKLVASRYYRSVFPGAGLKPKVNNATEFVTLQGGGRRAVTVGGSVTGIGADLIIVDDLMKASDANSDAMREDARRFFDETLYTRINKKASGSIVVVQQRLHQDDLIAHLQDKGTFEHLNLPAIAQISEQIPLYCGFVHEREQGDLLSHSRENEDTLAQIRRDLGEAPFCTQYLQDPEAAGSSMLDFSKVTLLDDEVADIRPLETYQVWDTAIKAETTNDYSVGITFGWDDERWVILDVIRRRMKFDALKAAGIAFHDKWKPDLVLVEDSANGSAMVTDLKKIERIYIKTLGVKGSKEERFSFAVDYLENGKLALLRKAPYFDDLRRELLAFPTSRHDDQVDAISLFVRRLRLPRPLPGKSGGSRRKMR